MEVEEEFASTLTPDERIYVKASMKGMFCFNLLLSTMLQGERGSRLASMIEKSLADSRHYGERASRGKKVSKAVPQADGFPDDVKYHREHTWVREDGTIGLTSYAQGQLGEIVYIEVSGAGDGIRSGEPFGVIESNKSVSELYAPVSGTIIDVNTEVLDAPELINEDPYGAGWIARVKFAVVSGKDGLLSAAEYREFVYGNKARR